MTDKEIQKPTAGLYEKIATLIEQSRHGIKTAVNTAMVYTYYSMGQYIVEEEQQGVHRAVYGKTLLKDLSAQLTARFGEGWSYSNLRQIRQFYLTYSNLTNSVCQISSNNETQPVADQIGSLPAKQKESLAAHPRFALSWSHYLVLMRIADPMERNFYEIECRQQDWSVRQLSRQVNSSLYER